MTHKSRPFKIFFITLIVLYHTEEEEQSRKNVCCPGADYLNVSRITKTKSSGRRCPETLNFLTRRMVPCNQAPTLREIALGRKIPRPNVRKMPWDRVRIPLRSMCNNN